MKESYAFEAFQSLNIILAYTLNIETSRWWSIASINFPLIFNRKNTFRAFWLDNNCIYFMFSANNLMHLMLMNSIVFLLNQKFYVRWWCLWSIVIFANGFMFLWKLSSHFLRNKIGMCTWTSMWRMKINMNGLFWLNHIKNSFLVHFENLISVDFIPIPNAICVSMNLQFMDIIKFEMRTV